MVLKVRPTGYRVISEYEECQIEYDLSLSEDGWVKIEHVCEASLSFRSEVWPLIVESVQVLLDEAAVEENVVRAKALSDLAEMDAEHI